MTNLTSETNFTIMSKRKVRIIVPNNYGEIKMENTWTTPQVNYGLFG